jgi:hypothetical protein
MTTRPTIGKIPYTGTGNNQRKLNFADNLIMYGIVCFDWDLNLNLNISNQHLLQLPFSSCVVVALNDLYFFFKQLS